MPSSFDPSLHHRRSIRLRGYDYSQGSTYFVTIVAHGGEPLFGRVSPRGVALSQAGQIVHETWEALPHHYPHVVLDAWIIMPDHVHGLLWLTSEGERGEAGRPRPALSEIVRALKSFSACRINEWRGTTGRVWQRSYYEHIVRDEHDLLRIRAYIAENPTRWLAKRGIE